MLKLILFPSKIHSHHIIQFFIMSGVISEKQKQLNKELHQSNKNFGNRATGAGIAQNLPTALNRMHELGVCNTFLDYGTGKGLLVQRLKKLVNPKINITFFFILFSICS